MKKISALIILLFSSIGLAQNKPAEIQLVLDNDLYVSSVNDKYYTNGFELIYRNLNTDTLTSFVKKITQYRIGQYIYNPQTIRASDYYVNDRPFAGYLYFEFGKHFFYVNESIIKINAQVGYVGPNAFGEETQKAFHNTFGYKKVSGWEYQIKNTLALQGNISYKKKLFSVNDKIDAIAVGESYFGTVNTQFSAGIFWRFGIKDLVPVYDSNVFGASLNTNSQTYQGLKEFYFFLQAKYQYQVYDATIQGSLFNDNSPVVFGLIQNRFHMDAGFKLRKNQWNLSYSFHYRTKEVKNWVNKPYYYGSISVGYILK